MTNIRYGKTLIGLGCDENVSLKRWVSIKRFRFLKVTSTMSSGKERKASHIGPKSLILAPQDIPDISGYQLGFGCQCVKAYNNENPVTNQKIL